MQADTRLTESPQWQHCPQLLLLGQTQPLLLQSTVSATRYRTQLFTSLTKVSSISPPALSLDPVVTLTGPSQSHHSHSAWACRLMPGLTSSSQPGPTVTSVLPSTPHRLPRCPGLLLSLLDKPHPGSHHYLFLVLPHYRDCQKICQIVL